MTNTDPIKALVDLKEAFAESVAEMKAAPLGPQSAPYHRKTIETILAAIEALKPMADVVMDDPFPIFSDRLRVRREECDEAEVSFDDSDILALAMDVLSGVGWKAPPASPAPVDDDMKKPRI